MLGKHASPRSMPGCAVVKTTAEEALLSGPFSTTTPVLLLPPWSGWCGVLAPCERSWLVGWRASSVLCRVQPALALGQEWHLHLRHCVAAAVSASSGRVDTSLANSFSRSFVNFQAAGPCFPATATGQLLNWIQDLKGDQ